MARKSFVGSATRSITTTRKNGKEVERRFFRDVCSLSFGYSSTMFETFIECETEEDAKRLQRKLRRLTDKQIYAMSEEELLAMSRSQKAK